MKRFRFVGSRIVKTGVAVFLTALLCDLIGWPPVFAVITAVVTIEPTVSDSIKKGMVRLPASAIGSGYAVLFISMFGNSPLTYTLAAVLTITTCYKLNLHAGLLVATLTSIAMVEVIHSNFLISFFIRLGTTTVGLAVSTIVNMFILPPNYQNTITKQVQHISRQTGIVLKIILLHIMENKRRTTGEEEMLKKLEVDIQKTETLCRFQHEETKYHPLAKSEESEFHDVQSQLNHLRSIHYHMNNLMYTPLEKLSWTVEEKEMITTAVDNLVQVFQNPSSFDRERHHKQQKEMTTIFWEDNEEITKNNDVYPTKFPPELIILYELLSIYNQVEQYFQYTNLR